MFSIETTKEFSFFAQNRLRDPGVSPGGIRKMTRNGTYADNLTIDTLGKALGCNITILQGDTPDYNCGVLDSANRLLLGYMPDVQHYVSVTAIEPEAEKYYAVYYTDPKAYYIGKVVKGTLNP